MISRSTWLGNHIIHIDFDLLMHHIREQGYHGLLVCRPSILQVEWHDVVGIGSLISGERRFGSVLFSHLDLITTWEPVHKGEEHVGHSVINQGINMWQGKIILWVGSIQISIIHTHAPNSKATCRPTMHTLYSVTLFVQSKFSLIETRICWPFEDTRTAPFPFPVLLVAPSK